MRRMKRVFITTLLASVVWAAVASCAWAAPTTLLDIYEILKTKEFVDLTHAFEPGIPHWPGFPDEKRETLYYYEPGIGTMGSGFSAQYFTHVGQWGTPLIRRRTSSRGSALSTKSTSKKWSCPSWSSTYTKRLQRIRITVSP